MSDETKKQPITDEIAGHEKDLDVYAGWLKRLENPDPTLRTEASGKGLKLYDEVDRDPHAGAVLQTRYLSVIGKEWEVLPGEEPSTKGRPRTVTQSQKIAEFVENALKQTNFGQMRQELLQAILYGFYAAEIMWDVQNGVVLPSRIRSKHPRRFSFTMDREPRLLTPSDMIEGEPLPDRKFIVFSYGSSDNPYGKGLGQKLWWPVWFKKNGIKFWLIFLEKFGMPTAIGKYPSGTLPEQQEALLDAIDAIQNETGIKIPDTMAIDLLEASRTGNVTYEALCQYMDRQISKAVLGQTATTEGTPGKLGNEDSQDDTKQDIIEADAGLLDECLNHTLIRWIVDYNFPGVTHYPIFHTRTAEGEDLESLAKRDRILTKDVGLPVSRRYFYETYAIPAPEEGEEVVFPSTSSPPDPETGDEKEKDFAEPSPDPVKEMSDALARAAVAPMDVLLKPVLSMIDNAKSFEEIGEKLYTLYPQMDSERFQELLGRAMSASGLEGYGDSQ